MSDDNSVHEKPAEFLSALKDNAGLRDTQSILPAGNHYVCHCTLRRLERDRAHARGGRRDGP